jgi:GT2 family glycosyltransferase
MSDLPSVSVVVTTYARRDSLPPVLDAITSDPHPHEVIVVVDGCADGSLELVAERSTADPRLRAVWRENGGEGAARQTGVEAASGDVVLILDDDVVAKPLLAQGHARAHARTPDAVVLGYMPTRVPATREPGQYATRLYAREYEARCAEYERDPESILRHLWAGNLSLRRADALRARLDARRLGYHDDQAFGLRCAAAGLRGVFDRSLVAEHTHSRDLDSFLRQARLAGAARRSLQSAHPDPSLDLDPIHELPVPLRPLLSAASRRALYPVAGRGLRRLLTSSARLHRWELEMSAARLLRHIELIRGFHGTRPGVTPS